MASEQEVMERARQIIAEQVTEGSPEKIRPDTVLDEEGGVDSLGFIYVLTTLEGEFGATVPDDKWREIHTLSDLARAIVRYGK
ncbi:MAG: acyl carrier protein [Coriobacteriales bacterium]|jgi:acyl carrier protein